MRYHVRSRELVAKLDAGLFPVVPPRAPSLSRRNLVGGARRLRQGDSAGTSRSSPSFNRTTPMKGPAGRNSGATDPATRKPTPRALSLSRASPSAGSTCRNARVISAAVDTAGTPSSGMRRARVERCLDRLAVGVDHPHPEPVGRHLDEDWRVAIEPSMRNETSHIPVSMRTRWPSSSAFRRSKPRTSDPHGHGRGNSSS